VAVVAAEFKMEAMETTISAGQEKLYMVMNVVLGRWLWL